MLLAPQFYDHRYWHWRAEEARALAKQMSNVRIKKTVLKIADKYDQLAVKAAIRSETKGN